MATKEKPETVTGGCLCENIRYTVTFPPDHDFAKAVRQPTCHSLPLMSHTPWVHGALK